LSRNHPCIDGNKRVAFVVMAVFLSLNGMELATEESGVVTTMAALADDVLDEIALADWIRSHSATRT
jgi:death-on-curing protein